MTKLSFHISVSLDGYITGPDPRPEEPLGDGGEGLHEWMAGLTDMRAERQNSADAAAADVIAGAYESVGALVMGRGMFDAGEEPWGDDPPFGMPVFIVTHHARETDARKGGTTYHFVTDGIDSALEQARKAAGGKDVMLWGGAQVINQYLAAGLLDELELHVVPVLLGDGARLFDNLGDAEVQLEQVRAVEAPGVTHLKYRVVT
jgi:dihydrofolate reductase